MIIIPQLSDKATVCVILKGRTKKSPMSLSLTSGGSVPSLAALTSARPNLDPKMNHGDSSSGK